MRKSASVIIRNLEARVARLERSSTAGGSIIEKTIRENMAKIQGLFDAGVLERGDYEKYMARFNTELASLRGIEDEGPMGGGDTVPQVGDILVNSWGSGMTFVDFYKVTKVSPSGKSVTLQQMDNNFIQGNMERGKVVPSTRPKSGEAPLKNKRITIYDGKYAVQIGRQGLARKWDGRPRHFTTLD